ncbi:MAG: signal peptidase II [Anaerolineales bacterium]
MKPTPQKKTKAEKKKLFWQAVLAYLSLIAIAGSIILLDQMTKDWVRNNLAYGESIVPFPELAPYARILHWRNTGAAFGIFQEGGGIFTILAIVVAIMIIFYFPRIQRGDWALRLAMGLQLGGALGNLIDRVQHNYMVTDFISVGSFPVFNLADTAITLGVIVLLLDIWLGGGEENVEQPPAQDPSSSE